MPCSFPEVIGFLHCKSDLISGEDGRCEVHCVPRVSGGGIRSLCIKIRGGLRVSFPTAGTDRSRIIQLRGSKGIPSIQLGNKRLSRSPYFVVRIHFKT